jgi:endonuclease/exonuclease/phosphatase family metal-dependent hydrolase
LLGSKECALIHIATFNLENLFTRPSAMNQATDAAGRKAIEDHAAANAIVAKDVYSAADKTKLIALSNKYKWHVLNPPASALVQLQKVRGALFKKPQNGPLQVVANGRGDWTGWFELKREDVSWPATRNTGRVIHEVNPDILITIEIEDRPTLVRFNDQVLGAELGSKYPHVLVVDGNDTRGIDVGILSRFPIETVRSHVDDPIGSESKTFSRDCPEFDVLLPGGARLVVMPNHFKSKRNGNDQQSQDQRRAQAERAKDIADAALARSPLVVVGGDLNDTPDSVALASLFADGFHDVIDHADYPQDRPGTYKTGLASAKLDYLICSPALWATVQTCGIERRGSYHPGTWAPFDTVTKAADEASDHHCVWVELGV